MFRTEVLALNSCTYDVRGILIDRGEIVAEMHFLEEFPESVRFRSESACGSLSECLRSEVTPDRSRIRVRFTAMGRLNGWAETSRKRTPKNRAINSQGHAQ